MAKHVFICILTAVVLSLPSTILSKEIRDGEFLVLCYHNVPIKVKPDNSYGVSQNIFIEQMEYLRTHGYQPISLDDIAKARKNKKALPDKPVLLTFDDAYISYYTFVFPVLETFGYPSVLAVVGAWIDNPPDTLAEPLMNWDQIRDVAQSDLVEIASHTYDLHKGIRYNPQGNIAPAVNVFAFDPAKEAYEREDDYRARIESDFIMQNRLFQDKLGVIPRAIVWPYGKFNLISIEEASKAGYVFTLTLEEGAAHVKRPHAINRNMVLHEPIENFIENLSILYKDKSPVRAAQIDMDLVYDPSSYEETDKKLGELIDRLVDMEINTVFLQAFADPKGTGDIKSVYFANRVLPVKADIFSHAVHQMIIRDMTVYAWMPTLSIILPDKELNECLRVSELHEGIVRPSTSWYKRLTPFSPTVKDIVRILYEDLAAHSQIQGILFQDDAYLSNTEDFHPLALSAYKTAFGEDISPDKLTRDPKLAMNWAHFKTKTLINFTKEMMEGVRKYRPEAKFARNLYAPVLTNPESELWFAQNYELSLRDYDYVAIMAYPQMEEIEHSYAWLRKLVSQAKQYPAWLEKTIFKVQAYNWNTEQWIEDHNLLEEIRSILAAGGRHVAYYPDNFLLDKPMVETIKLEMSTCAYPFIR
ncbi:MAG: poly-beta-1,6-N-acetyl-D-glucosamine N-deacetylase PgaB [Thermodesulfobacteriota bacterium]